MRKKKSDSASIQNPNFILCDMGLQMAFAQMCQNFQAQQNPKEYSQEWLVIDNDTGEIIMPSDISKT